jgi:tRNA(fMet)-specific endonuclease VapC
VSYLLDTNVCVDYLTGRYPAVVERMQASAPEDLRLSSVVVAELRYGADRSERPRASHSRVDALVGEIECLDFDLEAAAAYGRLRARLEESGKLIGPNDMLIAAHAVSRELVLVTDNVDEFRRVKGLKLDNWRR